MHMLSKNTWLYNSITVLRYSLLCLVCYLEFLAIWFYPYSPISCVTSGVTCKNQGFFIFQDLRCDQNSEGSTSNFFGQNNSSAQPEKTDRYISISKYIHIKCHVWTAHEHFTHTDCCNRMSVQLRQLRNNSGLNGIPIHNSVINGLEPMTLPLQEQCS